MRNEAGGHTTTVRSGESLNVASGGALKFAGTDKTAALAAAVATPVAGVAAGYKLARGEAALDGGNPTPIDTGLTTVIAFVATLKGSAAPGDNTSVLTALIGVAGSVDVHAWKNTGGSDPTLVASTGTESFYWIAIGT